MQSDGNRQSQMKSHWLPSSLSFSLSLCFCLLPILFLFLPPHSFSLLLLLSLFLIPSLLRFIVLLFFLYFSCFISFLVVFFFCLLLLHSWRGNWNSLLQSICCHTNACASATPSIPVLCFSLKPAPFIPHFCLHHTHPNLQPFTCIAQRHKYYLRSCPLSSLRNSRCIVGLDVRVCVCNVNRCAEMTLQSKEDGGCFGA